MTGNGKITWLLILQGWAMLWVVIGHAPLAMDNMPNYVDTLHRFAYSFHMPLFIAISGYLFHLTKLNRICSIRTDYFKIIFDKLIRLGIPFLVFTFIAMVVKVMFPGDMSRQTSLSIWEYVRAIINPFDGPLNELWFVGTIMWFFAFAPLWYYAGKSKICECILFLILLILHFMGITSNILCARQVCSNAIFFYSGILICKYHIDLWAQDKQLWLLISIPTYAIAMYFGAYFIATISAIIFSCSIAFILDKYYPSLFSSFRNYTYQIYLIGIFAQIAVKMIYRRIDMPYIAGYIMCILVGLYVPVLVSKLLEYINWKPLLICVGLKKKQ